MRLTVRGTLPAGDIWMTGFQVIADPGQTTDDVMLAWSAAWALAWNGTGAGDDLKSLVKTTVTADELLVTEVGPDGKNVTQSVQTISLAGTATDDCMPQHICPVWSLRSANASKKGRGRSYLMPLTEASNAGNGEIVSGKPAQIAAAGQNAIQHLNGASMHVVIFHRSTQTSDNVTAVDVANQFRTQRRRQNRVPVIRVRNTV